MRNATEIAEIITQLVKDKGTNVKAMLQECQLNRGLIDGMKRGQMPSAEKLSIVAEYLNTTSELLLGTTNDSDYNNESETTNTKYNNRNASLMEVIEVIKATPNRAASLCNGLLISDAVKKLVADYTGCSLDFLYDKDNIYIPDKKRIINPKAYTEIVEILDNCAANEKYRIIQIQLSLIVLLNLKVKSDSENFDINILKDKSFGLNLSVVNDLFSKIENPTHIVKYGFNISDLYKIRRRLAEKGIHISIEYMLTGIES